MFNELRRRRVPRYLIRLLYSYFKDRKVAFFAEGKYYTRRIYMEVPQGSVIGLLLWILYCDELLITPLPAGCAMTGFADDVGLTVEAITLDQLEALVQQCTALISGWLAERGLNLALQKTEWTFFNGKRVPPHYTLPVGEFRLEPKQAVRYVEVYFDRRRTFRTHIEQTVNKAIKTAGDLSRLQTNLHGPRMFVRKAYHAVVENIVLYAVPIWERAIMDARNAANIRRI